MLWNDILWNVILWKDILWNVMLWNDMLWNVMLWNDILWNVMLWNDMLCYVMLCFDILRNVIFWWYVVWAMWEVCVREINLGKLLQDSYHSSSAAPQKMNCLMKKRGKIVHLGGNYSNNLVFLLQPRAQTMHGWKQKYP